MNHRHPSRASLVDTIQQSPKAHARFAPLLLAVAALALGGCGSETARLAEIERAHEVAAGQEVGQASVARAKQDIQALTTAIHLYRLANDSHPASLDALVDGYVDRLARDPWGHSYIYRLPGNHGDFDLLSYGADGKPGGEGFDADIGN